LARRFLMLLEGQCLHESISTVVDKYGYCRQRYYQLLEAFQQGGLPALQPKKTGPKSNYRRTEQVVRQVLRYIFLDTDASGEGVVSCWPISYQATCWGFFCWYPNTCGWAPGICCALGPVMLLARHSHRV